VSKAGELTEAQPETLVALYRRAFPLQHHQSTMKTRLHHRRQLIKYWLKPEKVFSAKNSYLYPEPLINGSSGENITAFKTNKKA